MDERVRELLRDYGQIAGHCATTDACCDTCALANHIATLDTALAASRAEVEGLRMMFTRKNAALARPCINCGYAAKIVNTPPPVAPSGGSA